MEETEEVWETMPDQKKTSVLDNGTAITWKFKVKGNVKYTTWNFLFLKQETNSGKVRAC